MGVCSCRFKVADAWQAERGHTRSPGDTIQEEFL